MPGQIPPLPTPGGPGPVARYAVGVAVVVLAITSQYFVPPLWPASRAVYGSLPGAFALVYGVPVLALAFLIGPAPLRGWRHDLPRSTVVGLSWFGAMIALALVVTVGLLVAYAAFAPGALKLLTRENPALRAAAGDPWFFVGFSFVVGAFEETIFRGWIFGFWSGRSATWLTPALLSSALFAGLHLYYGTTYGVAAPVIFPQLFLLGFAFAATYRSTGGNLVVPAALHGAFDATSYLTLVSVTAGTDLHWLLVGAAALTALVYHLSRTARPTGRTSA